ncbi:MAG TPA: BTAD domain-containing putative transcriptional regulator [Thermomicrobiaceae bacterium]|nr:BTAD domain-containing putative transcriptional regulator [Thermomicrobiaceae bacterium]
MEGDVHAWRYGRRETMTGCASPLAPVPYDPALSAHWSLFICLLGSFQVFRYGHHMPVRSGGKTEAVLCQLALHHPRIVPRASLLEAGWPGGDPGLAGPALNSVIHALYKHLGSAGDAPPVVYTAGGYRLNPEAGVEVDIGLFDALASQGERQLREGASACGVRSFMRALEIYRGDLVGSDDIYAIVERERLRSRYLTLLGRVADHAYRVGEFADCLSFTQRLFVSDPCREEAHRLAMRCYVRLGERSQALRQYKLCREMLMREFDVEPEPSTTFLYDQIRLDPSAI